MSTVFRHRFPVMSVLAVLFLISLAPATLAAQTIHPLGLTHMQTPATTGKIVIKLEPESGLVMGMQGPVIRPGIGPQKSAASGNHSLRLLNLVDTFAGGQKLEKRFPTAEITRAGKAGYSSVPDMALYAHLDLSGRNHTSLLKIVAALNADPAVLVAFLEPVAVPAALGFDAFTGAVPSGVTPADTPDFESDQGYLGLAPDGVGATAMRGQAGSLGAGLTIIDVEGAWLWSHEDLPSPVVELGTQINDLGWRNHGTAVMGEMRGTDNGLGVTGITPSCTVGCSSIGSISTAGALLAAAENLSSGDLILIELHGPGPVSDGVGQFGYVPMEFWQDNFDAIRLITGRGIIVVEAAGNGYQDLDSPVYMDLFDRTIRDSGAIMCGATAGSTLDAAEFSNNGTRVDLNGWGWSVTTCGYGNLQGDPNPEEMWYTAGFSGTSSASPIVTGSVASLQGMVRERHGFDLDARLARDILLLTGTPTNEGHLIGARPNLVAAYAFADTGIGELSGTVTDAATGAPIAGVTVQVSDNGAFAVTDDLGQWRLALMAGSTDLAFTSYYYETGQGVATISPGQSTLLETSLNTLPWVDITGTVIGNGNTLAGCTVTVLNQPVSGTITAGDGTFTLSDIPAGYDFQLLFDGVPGFGAQTAFVTPTVGGLNEAHAQLPTIDEDFSGGDGGFVALDELWNYGTPPASVTGGAFTGDFCWGVGMDGNGYLDNTHGSLVSPDYDLTGSPTNQYYLSFHIFSATEGGFDGVNLLALANGDTTVLHPMDGYFDPFLGGLYNTSGWSGYTGRWRGVVFDISSYAGGTFNFQLDFGSDAGVTGDGFYMDGICISHGPEMSPVVDGGTMPEMSIGLSAWPNPFNPTVNIAYSMATPGHLQLVVFDVRGRNVKTLWNDDTIDAEGIVSWNGTDDAGHTLASGVYLVRAVTPGELPVLQRVVLAK
jgi:hypothetical protein